MNGIMIAVIVIAAVGLVGGIVLVIASRILAVKEDRRVSEITEALPGANCGSCGFAGCDACAEALVSGEAKLSACPVVNSENRGKIGELLGIRENTSASQLTRAKQLLARRISEYLKQQTTDETE